LLQGPSATATACPIIPAAETTAAAAAYVGVDGVAGPDAAGNAYQQCVDVAAAIAADGAVSGVCCSMLCSVHTGSTFAAISQEASIRGAFGMHCKQMMRVQLTYPFVQGNVAYETAGCCHSWSGCMSQQRLSRSITQKIFL
jgi:hypothetical protein